MRVGYRGAGRQPQIPAVIVQHSVGQAILEALVQGSPGSGGSGSERAALAIRLYAAPAEEAPSQLAEPASEPGQQQQEQQQGEGTGAGQCRPDELQRSGQQGQQAAGPPPARLELLVPPAAQPFLLDKVYKQQFDLSLVFGAVMQAVGEAEGAAAGGGTDTPAQERTSAGASAAHAPAASGQRGGQEGAADGAVSAGGGQCAADSP